MLQNLSSAAVVIDPLRVKRQTLTLCPPRKNFHDFFFCLSADFFQNQLYRKILLGIPSLGVKQIGTRSRLAFCQAWSGFKLLATIISRRH